MALLSVPFAVSILHGEDARTGVLTLINGNTVQGNLYAGESDGHLRWQGTAFTSPFEFRLQSIKSIKYPLDQLAPSPQEDFAFEFHSGDLISGRLSSWSEESIQIESQQFGTLEVRPQSIRRLHRIERNATSVFASLAGLQDWTAAASDTGGWNEDGNQLWTDQPGATLYGDFGVPDRAVVELELSWNDTPDFVFAIGVDESKTNASGWRLETAASKLTVIRESEDTADVDLVADLSSEKRIRITVYLDRKRGELQAFLEDGTPAGRIDAPNQPIAAQSLARGIRLVNRGRGLRLERMRIARWIGGIPARSGEGLASIALADGSFVSGEIRRMDADANALVIGAQDEETSVAIGDVIAVKFSSPEISTAPSACALFLHSGMRLSGNIDVITEDAWILSGDHLLNPVRVPRERVRTLIVFAHDALDASDPSIGRLGRLEIGSDQLSGRLTPAREEDGSSGRDSCLRWHPFGSRSASRLRSDASGRIVYRDRPKVAPTSTAARALAMQQLRLRQQRRGLNFGELFLERVDTSKSKAVKRDVHVIHIRSGDVIACRIESIDEQGVHLSTVDSDNGFVAHADVKAIELAMHSPPPDLKEAKRERLLTLPRLQKSSPPTHLLCSHNGDYLRCRLLGMDEEQIHIEVQLSEMTLPRDRVAQIIWFHEDEIKKPDDQTSEAVAVATADSRFDGMAQVVKRDGKRITFDPVEVTDDEVKGVSEIIGNCVYKLSEIDHLVFGDRIRSEVSDLAYNQWKLVPAVEPLVAKAFDGGDTGSESPLVGNPAPEIRLELLDGGDFRLSDYKGRVVVLDFWATWCAPCMQTMPLVEQAIGEFDADQVRLVSINLQEPAEHVRDVLERSEMELTVALDIDGIAAQRYEARAIPQMVIVDRDGKVFRLYVGGGAAVVEQMKAAIAELLQPPTS